MKKLWIRSDDDKKMALTENACLGREGLPKDFLTGSQRYVIEWINKI